MKLLVLYEAEGKEAAQNIRKQLKRLKVPCQEILVNGNWATPEPAFDDEITADTRIVAILTGTAYESSWFAILRASLEGGIGNLSRTVKRRPPFPGYSRKR